MGPELSLEFIQHTVAILPPALSPQTAILLTSIGKFKGLFLIQLIEFIESGNLRKDIFKEIFGRHIMVEFIENYVKNLNITK